MSAGPVDEIRPGDVCEVVVDIPAGGVPAFRSAERVLVERITPDMLRPEYRYVVYSTALATRFALSAADLRVVSREAVPPAPPPVAPGAGRRSGPVPWIAGGTALLLIIVLVLVVALGGRRDATNVIGRTVCLDPGHGGRDTGALENGVPEKDVNLDIALEARDILEQLGYRVVMTRDTDVEVSLQRRCDIANSSGARVLVSIHNNSRPPDVQGTTTYYLRDSEEGLRLAGDVQEQVVSRIRRPDRGTRASNLYVVRNTSMPAALLEGVFLSDEEEADLVRDESFRRGIAEGIAAGIEAYLLNSP